MAKVQCPKCGGENFGIAKTTRKNARGEVISHSDAYYSCMRCKQALSVEEMNALKEGKKLPSTSWWGSLWGKLKGK